MEVQISLVSPGLALSGSLLFSSPPAVALALPHLLTWTRVHGHIRNLGASATPAARILALLNLGEDLGLGDGVV